MVLANQNEKLTGPDQGFVVSRLVLTLKPWERGCLRDSGKLFQIDVENSHTPPLGEDQLPESFRSSANNLFNSLQVPFHRNSSPSNITY